MSESFKDNWELKREPLIISFSSLDTIIFVSKQELEQPVELLIRFVEAFIIPLAVSLKDQDFFVWDKCKKQFNCGHSVVLTTSELEANIQ